MMNLSQAGSLTVYGSKIANSSTNALLQCTDGTYYADIALASTAGTYITGSGAGDACILSSNGISFGSTGGTQFMRLTSAGLSIPNNLTVGGITTSSYLQTTGTAFINGYGGYMGWNRTGSGTTEFANQEGMGIGGWEWVAYNSSNTLTGSVMTLSQTGQLQTAGDFISENTNPLIKLTDGTYSTVMGTNSTANAFITGTAAGDSCILANNNFAVGTTAGTLLMNLSNVGDLTINGPNFYMGGGNNAFIDNTSTGTVAQVVVGYNTFKFSGQNAPLQVYNNVTDRAKLFQIQSAGTSSGYNGVEICGTSGVSWVGVTATTTISGGGAMGYGNGAMNFGPYSNNGLQWCTFYGLISSTVTAVGSIFQNVGGGTTFSTTSDYRLKSNLKRVDPFEILEKVKKQKVYHYNYRGYEEHETKEIGFLAHEIQEEFPSLVKGVKDGEEYQQLDYMRITPILTAAIQAQQEMINDLQKRLNVLENNST